MLKALVATIMLYVAIISFVIYQEEVRYVEPFGEVKQFINYIIEEVDKHVH